MRSLAPSLLFSSNCLFWSYDIFWRWTLQLRAETSFFKSCRWRATIKCWVRLGICAVSNDQLMIMLLRALIMFPVDRLSSIKRDVVSLPQACISGCYSHARHQYSVDLVKHYYQQFTESFKHVKNCINFVTKPINIHFGKSHQIKHY